MTNDPENNLLLIDCVVARILQTMVGMLEPNASILRFNFIGGNDDGCSVAEVGYRMAYNAITGYYVPSSNTKRVIVPTTTMDTGEKLLPMVVSRAKDYMQYMADYRKYVSNYINVPYGDLESLLDILNAFVERLVTIVGEDRYYSTSPYHCGYVIFDGFNNRVLFQLSANTDPEASNDDVLTIVSDKPVAGFTLNDRQELVLDLPTFEYDIITGMAQALDELAVMYAKLGSIEDNDNV